MQNSEDKQSNMVQGHPRIIKRLVSKRKLLHSKPPSLTYDESPVRKVDKKNLQLNLLKTSAEQEKDKSMKAGIKYLRNLGELRRHSK